MFLARPQKEKLIMSNCVSSDAIKFLFKTFFISLSWFNGKYYKIPFLIYFLILIFFKYSIIEENKNNKKNIYKINKKLKILKILLKILMSLAVLLLHS